MPGLPPFSGEDSPMCTKCGVKGGALTAFRRRFDGTKQGGTEHEYLERTCRQCGWSWKEACVEE